MANVDWDVRHAHLCDLNLNPYGVVRDSFELH